MMDRRRQSGQRANKLAQSLVRVAGFEPDINRLLAALNEANANFLQSQDEPLGAYVARTRKLFADAVETAQLELRHIRHAMTELPYLISAKEAAEVDVTPPSQPSTPVPTNKTAPRPNELDRFLLEPLPIHRDNNSLPPLCGPVPAPDDYVVPPNALVAARIDDTDKDTFILARVIEFVRKRNRYEVVDVDTSDKEAPPRYQLPPKSVIPLPTSMPDYTKAGKNHEFEKGTRVLAMYPETTCFYQGTVIAPPSKRKATHDYLIEYDSDEPPPKTCPAHFVLAVPVKGRRGKAAK